jgi:hypothetical protein
MSSAAMVGMGDHIPDARHGHVGTAGQVQPPRKHPKVPHEVPVLADDPRILAAILRVFEIPRFEVSRSDLVVAEQVQYLRYLLWPGGSHIDHDAATPVNDPLISTRRYS